MPKFSKKMVMNMTIVCLSTITPIAYKTLGISDGVAMTVLAIYAAIGGVYNIVQGQLDKKEMK